MCTTIVWCHTGAHPIRWLASVLIVFPKRLADFLEKMKFCTIPTWAHIIFLHRNSNLVISTKRPKSCTYGSFRSLKVIGLLQILWMIMPDPLPILRNDTAYTWHFWGSMKNRVLIYRWNWWVWSITASTLQNSLNGSVMKVFGSCRRMVHGGKALVNLTKYTMRPSLGEAMGWRNSDTISDTYWHKTNCFSVCELTVEHVAVVS